MDHGPAVANRPARTSRTLVADEPIFHAQPVVRVFVLREDVPESSIELWVLIVGDFQNPVLDAEGVAKILTGFITLDLDRPTFQVLAIEQSDPPAPALLRAVLS